MKLLKCNGEAIAVRSQFRSKLLCCHFVNFTSFQSVSGNSVNYIQTRKTDANACINT